MEDFKQGTQIPLKIGGYITVRKKLGEGGQGAVYLVEYEGKQYALKWYPKSPDAKFLKNIENNIRHGKPGEAFLWPEQLVGPYEGSYGYIMALRPPGYEDFTRFLLAKVQFGSLSAMLVAAMEICEGFEKLHLKGYTYQDLNDGNFFIHPETGHVLICDNDNVCECGRQSGIAGKSRYMAPEIVRGDMEPDRWTDLFSLAVVLYLLFFGNHPLEGQLTASMPCMTEEAEKKFYGISPVFIWDETDKSNNRPVRGIHNNVIRRWPVFPAILRDAFLRAFSRDTMVDAQQFRQNRQTRMKAVDWKKTLVSMRNLLVQCPHCKQETCLQPDGESKCMECGKPISKPKFLKSGKEQIALMNGTKLYASSTKDKGSYYEITGEVIADKNNRDLLGIRNLSKDVWFGFTRVGEQRNVEPGGVIPVLEGIKITFQGGSQAEIV